MKPARPAAVWVVSVDEWNVVDLLPVAAPALYPPVGILRPFRESE